MMLITQKTKGYNTFPGELHGRREIGILRESFRLTALSPYFKIIYSMLIYRNSPLTILALLDSLHS